MYVALQKFELGVVNQCKRSKEMLYMRETLQMSETKYMFTTIVIKWDTYQLLHSSLHIQPETILFIYLFISIFLVQ